MNKNFVLEISNLFVSLNDKKIINDFNLNISPGEVHVIMGPNGVGKSTLARFLAGDYSNYFFSGSVLFDGVDLFKLAKNEIALNGLFLSFQNPIDIPGVSNLDFFKSFLNYRRKCKGIEPLNTTTFLNEVKIYMKSLAMDEKLLHRYLNVDFSGGEKKKNEVLQMLLLKPRLSILDEIDSGLDVDSLKNVFNSINCFKNKDSSLLIITHYTRILDYIDIDFIHVMCNGKIVKTGKTELLNDINNNGYFQFT
ncbi:MAG TPA: Fe-S cluster assembly ATPase SufC [Candidatus Azoamicus sp.]